MSANDVESITLPNMTPVPGTPTPPSGNDSPTGLHIPQGRDGFYGYQDEKTLHQVRSNSRQYLVWYLILLQIEEKKYAHRRGSDVGGSKPISIMNSPVALRATPDAHSEAGSAVGSFKLPAMHDFARSEAASSIHEDMGIHPSAAPDIPGVIHGECCFLFPGTCRHPRALLCS